MNEKVTLPNQITEMWKLSKNQVAWTYLIPKLPAAKNASSTAQTLICFSSGNLQAMHLSVKKEKTKEAFKECMVVEMNRITMKTTNIKG